MAETQPKRNRDESHDAETPDFDSASSNPKRQKPYSNILSLLDEEEGQEEPSQDLSAIFTTLQQELSSPTTTFDFDSLPPAAEEDPRHQQTSTTTDPSTSAAGGGEEDDGVKSVIRHLLEASDDELGIPNTDYNTVEIKSDENFPFGFADNGLWELEDVAANYYTILQAELFM